MICQVFHFDESEEIEWMKCKGAFNIYASVDYPGELICIGCIYIDPAANAMDADKLDKVMNRMGDWYYAYMKWEDDLII